MRSESILKFQSDTIEKRVLSGVWGLRCRNKRFYISLGRIPRMVAFEERVRDPVTGLPIELFTWEEVEKELKPVKIRYERRKGKDVTIIENLPLSDENIWNFLKETKRVLACGGTYKEGYVLLQGDHRYKVAKLLKERWGIPEEQIEVE